MLVKKLCLIWVFLLAAPLFACGSSAGYGEVTVRVCDGYTDLPIVGACVTVPETGASFTTSPDGRTGAMLLPVIPDAEYEHILPSGTGRVTLIVTAEGFTPCLMLYVRVSSGMSREISVLLFPADGSLSVFPLIEAPDEDWCLGVVEKYR